MRNHLHNQGSPWMALAIAAMLGFSLVMLWQADASAACRAGDSAKVLWEGKWYPATVTGTKENSCCIHYDGFDRSWDECVGADRIKLAGKDGSTPDTEAYKKGDKVQAKWKGEWYPATVIAVKSGSYRIHYDNFGSSWDEWVSPDHLNIR
ncbi:MAG: Tudor-knot domain-containing protein [Pseudomonadota bacterium]